MNIKLKVLGEWKTAHKQVHMWLMGLPASFLGVWTVIPAELKASLPSTLITGVTIGMLVIGMLVKQDTTSESK